MKKQITYLLLLVCLLFIAMSCKTYYIPVESFKKQFAGMDAVPLRMVATRLVTNQKDVLEVYPVDSIFCIDKKGNPAVLTDFLSRNIVITDKRNQKAQFAFYRIKFRNNIISGYEKVQGNEPFEVLQDAHSFTLREFPLDSVKQIKIIKGKRITLYYKN